MGAKSLPRDRTCTVGPEGKFLIRCVMCVAKATGNESSIESSRNAEETTRGAMKVFHQSPINRWSLFRR